MDLNEAETFVRVVEAGGMTPAAQLLGVPRSTVSRRVARLEKDLGVTLLKRSTRKMSLTDEGRAFFQQLRPALETAREAAAVVRDAAGEPQGTLRVSAPADFAHAVLAPLMSEFAASQPHLSLEISLDNRLVDLIGEGYDCAIRAGVMPDSSLVTRTLATYAFGVYASPRYLAEHGRPTTVAELAEHRCVLFRPSGVDDIWSLQDSSGQVAEVTVGGGPRTDDLGFAAGLVREGSGLGLLPSFVTRDVERGDLERVLPAFSWPSAQVHFVTPARRYQPAKVKAFREFLTARLADG